MTVSRTVDRVTGFGLLLVAFVAAVVIALRSSANSEASVAPDRELPGFPGRVEPLAALPRARALTGRPNLRRLFATRVDSDGRVDLGHPLAGVRYEFSSADGSGEHCGRQTVHLTKQGLFAAKDFSRATCGASDGKSLPEPRCSLREIWQKAQARGAEPSGLAVIEYFGSRSGPAWKFTLPNTKVRFVLAADCGSELTGGASLKL